MKAVAERIGAKVGFDPTIILTILSIALELWKQCHDVKDLPGASLPRLYRRRLAKVIRQHDAPPGTLEEIIQEIKTVKIGDLDV